MMRVDRTLWLDLLQRTESARALPVAIPPTSFSGGSAGRSLDTLGQSIAIGVPLGWICTSPPWKRSDVLPGEGIPYRSEPKSGKALIGNTLPLIHGPKLAVLGR